MTTPHWRNGLRTGHTYASAYMTPSPADEIALYYIIAACLPPESAE